MADEFSFDIVSEVNFQEVDNAINQALKEIATRFDFKGTNCHLSFDLQKKEISLLADNDMHLKSLIQILQEKFAKRGVSVKTLNFKPIEKAMDGMLRQNAEIQHGIQQEKAKEIVKKIKEHKIRVQASIQGDKVRVSSKSKDALQEAIQIVKAQFSDIPLQFINYR